MIWSSTNKVVDRIYSCKSRSNLHDLQKCSAGVDICYKSQMGAGFSKNLKPQRSRLLFKHRLTPNLFLNEFGSEASEGAWRGVVYASKTAVQY